MLIYVKPVMAGLGWNICLSQTWH